MKRKIFIGVLIIIMYFMFGINLCNAENITPNVSITGNIDSEKNITINIQASGILGFSGVISFDSDVIEYLEFEEKNGSQINVDKDKLTISAIIQDSNEQQMKDIAILKFKSKNTEDNTTEGIYITNLKILKSDGTIEENLTVGDTITINENSTNRIGIFDDDLNAQFTEGNASDEKGNTIVPSKLTDQTNTVVNYGGDFEDTEFTDINDNEENEGQLVNAELSEETKTEDEESISADGETVYGKDVTKANDAITDGDSEKVEKQIENISNKKIPQTGLIVTIVPITIATLLLIIGCIAYKKSQNVK